MIHNTLKIMILFLSYLFIYLLYLTTHIFTHLLIYSFLNNNNNYKELKTGITCCWRVSDVIVSQEKSQDFVTTQRFHCLRPHTRSSLRMLQERGLRVFSLEASVCCSIRTGTLNVRAMASPSAGTHCFLDCGFLQQNKLFHLKMCASFLSILVSQH